MIIPSNHNARNFILIKCKHLLRAGNWALRCEEKRLKLGETKFNEDDPVMQCLIMEWRVANGCGNVLLVPVSSADSSRAKVNFTQFYSSCNISRDFRHVVWYLLPHSRQNLHCLHRMSARCLSTQEFPQKLAVSLCDKKMHSYWFCR